MHKWWQGGGCLSMEAVISCTFHPLFHFSCNKFIIIMSLLFIRLSKCSYLHQYHTTYQRTCLYFHCSMEILVAFLLAFGAAYTSYCLILIFTFLFQILGSLAPFGSLTPTFLLSLSLTSSFTLASLTCFATSLTISLGSLTFSFTYIFITIMSSLLFFTSAFFALIFLIFLGGSPSSDVSSLIEVPQPTPLVHSVIYKMNSY